MQAKYSTKPVEKIIIVDDDLRLGALLKRLLEENGFYVRVVPNAEQLDRALHREIFSLLVLDLMIPGEDGISICRRLRKSGNPIPIVMLTAKDYDEERVEGLQAGADDYISKPFNPAELIERMRAVLRRCRKVVPGGPSRESRVVSFGPWRLNLGTRQLTHSDGKNIHLTTGEFAVMKTLCEHEREALTRDKITTLARGREWQASERAIDVQVSRLRRILEINPSQPRFLQTVWGIGYVFIPD